SRVAFRARLLRTGSPIAGQTLLFKVGGLERRAVTDADGVASILVNLLLLPGQHDLLAGFAGAPNLDRSATRRSFVVRRADTQLDLTPESLIASPTAAETLVARLRGTDSDSIPDQPVIFLVTGPGGTLVKTVDTDFAGRAPLGALGLPAGTYTVSATFGQEVTPPAPLSPLGGPSLRYQSATANTTVILDAAAPVAEDDRITGRAGFSLKVAISDLTRNDHDPDGGPLELASFDATTGRGQSITRSGEFLLLAELSTRSAADAFRYTIRDASGKTASARVVVAIEPNQSPSANILGIERLEGFVLIRFAGLPGRRYLVQASPDLLAPVWLGLGDITVGSDGTAEFMTPEPEGPTFFRTAFP
ncbi:MAG: hypothetical protein IT580_08170, partial [Verrucomicrobiales bacterium]|nr:hypothetical protein [Verrucomicrobiales bacterium]